MLSLASPTTITYPESDGAPMGETGFHVKLIAYVISLLSAYYHRRPEVYVGGNMFLYYEEGNPREVVSPDVFVAFGVEPGERRSWFTWEENKVPAVVFEFTSRSTKTADMGTKKGLYEWLGVQEYFLFDPLDEYLHPRFRGYRLQGGLYEAIPETANGLASAQLGLTLRPNEGLLDFSVTATGERLLPPAEYLDAL